VRTLLSRAHPAGVEKLGNFGLARRRPLSRYVTYANTIEMRLDVSSRSWRMARSIISTVEPLLPRRLAAAAHWIVG